MSITPMTSVVVKLQHRGDAKTIYRSNREAFWGELIFTAKSLKAKAQSQEVMLDDIDLLEARIEHKLGPALRAKMVRVMVEGPINLINENTESINKTSEILYHLGHARAPLEIDPAPFIKLAHEEIEYLRQRNGETPYRTELNTRVVAAASVFFSTKVAGYDSLSLDLVAAPASSLSDVFRGDVVAFKTFLESSLPDLFTGCLPSKFRPGTSKLCYTVTIPDSLVAFFTTRTDPSRS